MPRSPWKERPDDSGFARLPAVALLGSAAAAPPEAPAAASAHCCRPHGPRQPLRPPDGHPPVPDPGGASSTRELALEEAVAIALDNQPQIQRAARRLPRRPAAGRPGALAAPAADQPALEHRPAGASLLRVQLEGGSASGSAQVHRRSRATSRPASTASQLLFDFGKTWAATDAAKASSEAVREQVEIQKDLTVLAVKESYFTLLLARRLVIGADAGRARPRRAQPPERARLLRGRHAAATST